MQAKSGQWNNNLAFLLAATGSAVGLGNIWGFPYKAGENGGGLFVLLYIFFVIVLGLPVFMAEVFIGKVGKGNPVGAVEALAKKTKSSRNWNLVAYSGILASLIIAGYYAVIAGLVINYGFIAAAGFVGTDPGVVYAQEISSFWEMTFWFSIFLLGSGIVVGFGIEKGIESAMRILLPLLFVLVILMVGYGAVRGDMPAALDYLFSWKADQFNPGTVQAAVGQAFFSLSIGMGTLMAFGSYMPKSQQVSKSSVIVVTADTGVALFAGLAIFPLVFFFALDPTAGTELVFKTMTTAFAEMGLFGQFIGPLFYFLLAVAAFSSMISILEPSVVFVSEKFNFSRFKSSMCIVVICFFLSLISVAGFNVLNDLSIGALDNPFEAMKYLADDFLLLLVGTGISLFVGHRLQNVITAEATGISNTFLLNLWVVILKYISPISLMIIWLLGNAQVLFGVNLLDYLLI